jgi:hypothetical protein
MRLAACTMAWLMLTRRWLSADNFGVESLDGRRITNKDLFKLGTRRGGMQDQ